MEIKVNAIVTRSVDYKDNDKILTLYSLEKGKITAGIKGVKKANAKLKFASEPFCFAEYVLTEKNGRYTVINASYIDSFYELRLNLEKYYVSAGVLDVVNNLLEWGIVEPNVFKATMSVVKNICYRKNERQSLALYLLTIAEYLGYGINELSCYSCGEEITGRVFFRYSDAYFSCSDCRLDGFSEITADTYTALSLIKESDFDTVTECEIPPEKTQKLLKFLLFYLSVKTDVKLKTAQFLN